MAHSAPIAAVFGLLVVASPAAASSSDMFETEGGTVRIVTAGLPDGDGLLRGAIEIALRPGWKTYWRDPGSSGVPPQIDVSRSRNVASAEIDFPLPAWHDEGYGAWAGYSRTVSLPVSFHIPRPDRYALVTADVFLGICQTICIPVKAALEVEPGAAPDDPAHALLVEDAFASLPAPPVAGLRLVAGRIEGDALMIQAEIPDDDGEARLFLAGDGRYGFGKPVRIGSGFMAPITARPRDDTGKVRFAYTLAAGARAVAGWLELP